MNVSQVGEVLAADSQQITASNVFTPEVLFFSCLHALTPTGDLQHMQRMMILTNATDTAAVCRCVNFHPRLGERCEENYFGGYDASVERCGNAAVALCKKIAISKPDIEPTALNLYFSTVAESDQSNNFMHPPLCYLSVACCHGAHLNSSSATESLPSIRVKSG